AVTRFGEQGVMDLVGVNGFYSLISMALNVGRTPLPPGVAPALKPTPREPRLSALSCERTSASRHGETRAAGLASSRLRPSRIHGHTRTGCGGSLGPVGPKISP